MGSTQSTWGCLLELPTLLLRHQRESLESTLYLMGHQDLTDARSRLLVSFTLPWSTILAKTTCLLTLWLLLELWMLCLVRLTDKLRERNLEIFRCDPYPSILGQ